MFDVISRGESHWVILSYCQRRVRESEIHVVIGGGNWRASGSYCQVVRESESQRFILSGGEGVRKPERVRGLVVQIDRG